MQIWKVKGVRLAPALAVALASAVAFAPARSAHAARRGAGLRRIVDVNAASATELAAVPGISERLAAAIVESRDAHGPFRWPRELQRVKGIGPRLAPRIARCLTFAESGGGPGQTFEEPQASRPAQPIDLNLATPEELAPMPGLGWGLAYRIVAERERNGAFRTLDDLLYLRGVTQDHVDRWRAYVYVEGR